jgi:hypothetical protein
MKQIWTIFLLASAARGADVRLSITGQSTTDNFVRIAAVERTTRMFAAIGIRLEWNYQSAESAQDAVAIQVRFVKDVAGHPNAMAFSNPFDPAPVITVMYDRIVAATPRGQVTNSAVLAHVLAHEIGHILQRTNAHSPEGIMKTNWQRDEFSRMAYRPLTFLPADADMMRRGLHPMFQHNEGSRTVAP